MKKIKLSLWGGFHNVSPINVEISASDYETLRDHVATVDEVLRDTQLKQVQRHFCDVQECSCGGVRRAYWRRVRTSNHTDLSTNK